MIFLDNITRIIFEFLDIITGIDFNTFLENIIIKDFDKISR